MTWQLPTARPHRLAGQAGPLTFVGGAGDFDDIGTIRRSGVLNEQLGGALENVRDALAAESCGLEDVVRLKAFYRSGGDIDEWSLRAALANGIGVSPAPVMTLNPVPLQPWSDQSIQLQAIALRGWRQLEDVRVVTRQVPDANAAAFDDPVVTDGLRAGEFYAVGSQTAAGQTDGRALAETSGADQTPA